MRPKFGGAGGKGTGFILLGQAWTADSHSQPLKSAISVKQAFRIGKVSAESGAKAFCLIEKGAGISLLSLDAMRGYK